jgi:hypothetical protein
MGVVWKKSRAKCTGGKCPRMIHCLPIVIDHWKILTKYIRMLNCSICCGKRTCDTNSLYMYIIYEIASKFDATDAHSYTYYLERKSKRLLNTKVDADSAVFVHMTNRTCTVRKISNLPSVTFSDPPI